MNELTQMILTGLVALVTGSGLTVLCTIRSLRQKAKADAMQSVQDVYQETIDDLRKDRQLQREEFERQVTELKNSIDTLKREVDALKKLKCYNLECPVRVKHS